MNVLIIGSSSKVSVELSEILISEGHRCTLAGREGPDIIFDSSNLAPEAISSLLVHDYDFYVINSGLLTAQNFLTQPKIQLLNSVTINLLAPVYIAESILTKKAAAKVFIIGSESGRKGSFDITYFLCKAAIRAYVRQRYLNEQNQQLLLFSPATIEDAGMSTRRSDPERIAEYRQMHPKKRLLESREMAAVLRKFMSKDFSYISNVEIEINGGKFARMRVPN